MAVRIINNKLEGRVDVTARNIINVCWVFNFGYAIIIDAACLFKAGTEAIDEDESIGKGYMVRWSHKVRQMPF